MHIDYTRIVCGFGIQVVMWSLRNRWTLSHMLYPALCFPGLVPFWWCNVAKNGRMFLHLYYAEWPEVTFVFNSEHRKCCIFPVWYNDYGTRCRNVVQLVYLYSLLTLVQAGSSMRVWSLLRKPVGAIHSEATFPLFPFWSNTSILFPFYFHSISISGGWCFHSEEYFHSTRALL